MICLSPPKPIVRMKMQLKTEKKMNKRHNRPLTAAEYSIRNGYIPHFVMELVAKAKGTKLENQRIPSVKR